MSPRTKVAGHPNWKPGESGNPAGPPKGSVRPSAKLRKLIDVPRIIKKL